ncbi:MAG: hypothetical protein FJZ58_08095 [Chlamydiae bacterium]|nr:hypothetical protein [Chlamydiota bacterium]
MDEVQAHEAFKGSMLREIDIMREMLSSLLQEESFLLTKDQHSWSRLIHERHGMVEQLQHSREHRDRAAKKLKDYPFASEEGECEISLLIDQLKALTDKVQQQHQRNQALSKQMQQGAYEHNYATFFYAEAQAKKPLLTTISEVESLEEE